LEIPKFEFKRFKPSRALITKAEAVLLHLIDFVPPDASVFVCLSKKLKNQYNCLIHVKAPDAQFVQNISANDPTRAIDHVTQKIKDEILSWKLENLVMVEPSFWNFKEVK
jgi:ribosome-associated translation inhibitor RaiA